ncbi:hypothetical protein K501DRAFT_20662 [Backusella circina FSU 941]|nr:hypothetical protein K501DRAFT_20662 [Backusella circina FSU 941]
MQSIASHNWGVERMAQSSEFMDYILDRTTEDTEHGQTWKYAIVQLLVSSRDASRVLGSYYPQCQVYVRQGAHYVPMIARAAVESN